ncbi:MAG: metallophosphoesterase, partial [Tissierellia bacterium]|nr:metallophosphoesterase [Tissierellia bacterium]
MADLHNKDWGPELIDILAKEEPDMIAVVGDLIDSSEMDIDVAMEFIKKAKKISPIYYVPGNHEAWSGEYEPLRKSLLKEAVVVLDDEGVVLSKGGDDILLLG